MVSRLHTYAARRAHIRHLFQPLLQAIEHLESEAVGTALPGSDATRWAAVDGQVAQLRVRLAHCSTSEDAQAVGLLCRDLLISLAQAAHDPNVHGEVGPSAVDQLNNVIDFHAGGEENAKLRKLLKASIDYANDVQHRRGGRLAEAGLVAEATVASVYLVKRLIDGLA